MRRGETLLTPSLAELSRSSVQARYEKFLSSAESRARGFRERFRLSRRIVNPPSATERTDREQADTALELIKQIGTHLRSEWQPNGCVVTARVNGKKLKVQIEDPYTVPALGDAKGRSLQARETNYYLDRALVTEIPQQMGDSRFRVNGVEVDEDTRKALVILRSLALSGFFVSGGWRGGGYEEAFNLAEEHGGIVIR